MHDLFEGIVTYEMKLLLCHCVPSKYFTIGELNARMEEFFAGSNHPSPIDPKITTNPIAKIR